jgi:lysophospholipase L1-like esterase
MARIFKKQGAPSSGHTDKEVHKYAQAAMDVAHEKKVSTLDFNKIIRETSGETYSDLYADGVHLSKQGGELLAKHLLPVIKKNIGDELKEKFS